MNMIKKIALLSLLTALAPGSLTTILAKSNNDLTQLGFVKIPSHVPTGVNSIRLEGIREAATSLGARGGLAWQSKHINMTLDQQANDLDRIFNFQALLINNRVLPPILAENDASTTATGNDSLRSADKTYTLLAPARFATTAPNWRTYLTMNFQKPQVPDSSLVPKNKAEISAWNYYLKVGWNQGLQQANAIFSANLNRLKRDYRGMVLYRQLLAQNMVLPPHMAEAKLGVTGNGKQMRIGDRIYRITAHSNLQTNSKLWSPVIVSPK